MDTDRPYFCNDCMKSFKLKWHLKTHMQTCKGKETDFCLTCDKCESRFSSKRTLAFHVKTCLPGKCYWCEVCNTKFVLYKQLYDHKRKCHTSLECDYCDTTISSQKNMKRHVTKKHKGLTPSRARALEVNKVKLSKPVKSFKCDTCEKTFHDKSTLNRHKKVHTFVCKTCEKVFTSKDDLNKHTRYHDEKADMVKIKKNVVWADELEDVKEISITKIAFNSGTSASIKQMFSSIEAFMPLAANRNKSLKINEFKEAYENVSRKNFDELTFRALLSVYPEAYNVKVSGNILHVKFNGKAKPNDLFERKEGFIDKMNELDEQRPRYIDLIEFEVRKETPYKTAQQTIMENIVKFSDEDDNDDDHLYLEVLESNQKFTSGFERLKNIIENKRIKKERREKKFTQIDWQAQRLDRLARLVHKIFVSEKKTALRVEFLEERLKNSDYSTSTVKSDLERLIKNSNGWLKVWRGWVKKNSSIDATKFVKLF